MSSFADIVRVSVMHGTASPNSGGGFSSGGVPGAAGKYDYNLAVSEATAAAAAYQMWVPNVLGSPYSGGGVADSGHWELLPEGEQAFRRRMEQYYNRSHWYESLQFLSAPFDRLHAGLVSVMGEGATRWLEGTLGFALGYWGPMWASLSVGIAATFSAESYISVGTAIAGATRAGVYAAQQLGEGFAWVHVGAVMAKALGGYLLGRLVPGLPGQAIGAGIAAAVVGYDIITNPSPWWTVGVDVLFPGGGYGGMLQDFGGMGQ